MEGRFETPAETGDFFLVAGLLLKKPGCILCELRKDPPPPTPHLLCIYTNHHPRCRTRRHPRGPPVTPDCLHIAVIYFLTIVGAEYKTKCERYYWRICGYFMCVVVCFLTITGAECKINCERYCWRIRGMFDVSCCMFSYHNRCGM